MTLNFEDLTPDEIIKLAEQFKSEEQLSKMQRELELLLVKSEIEEIDKQAEISELKEEISFLKEQSDESSEVSNLLIKNFRNQSVLQERIEKLDQKRNTIQLEVYQALKVEYSTELDKLTQDLSKFMKKIEISRQQTQPLIQVLNFQIEELAVRKEVEELSEEDFSLRNQDLNTDLENKTKYLAALEFILQQVKR